MIRLHRILIFIYLPLTVILLLADHLFPGLPFIRWCKLLMFASLLGIAVPMKKKYPEQKEMFFCLFMVVWGDVFFFAYLINQKGFAALLGALCFLAAYLGLLDVFLKKPRFDIRELFLLLPLLAVLLYALQHIRLFLATPLSYGVGIFAIILVLMSWRSSCTVFEGYYSLKASLMMAAAGHLILISDLTVGAAVFYPELAGAFNPYVTNTIWGTLLLAWFLINMLIAEDNLYR